MIHIAKKDLRLAEDAYRDLLENVTGKRSAAELDVSELNAVLEAFEGLGFRVQGSGKGRLSPTTRHKDAFEKTQADKIRALWIECYRVGVVRNRYESGLQAFCKRLTKVDRVEWLNKRQATTVIEALKAMFQ